MKEIYLTFDDGPSATTRELLEVLDKHKVKATFFVTCEFGENKELLRLIKSKGHEIGLHSYSHNFAEIYKSVDAYLNDLQTIDDYVYKSIGEKKRIIRFPGGSGNISSLKYGGRIMPEIIKKTKQLGYIEFDWNAFSGDGNTNKTHSVIYYFFNAIKSINIKSKVIYLSHNRPGDRKSIKALNYVIVYCKLMGYEFKKIDETTIPINIEVK